LTSAGTAVTKGVEIDFTAMPIPNLLINGGISYTDATFDDYPDGLCYVGQPVGPQDCIDLDMSGVGDVQDLSGKQINNAPKWKYAIQGRYDVELATPFDLFVSSTYRWQDDSPGEISLSPSTFHDSYGVLDLVVGLEADGGRWSAHVFAKNVLDDHYVDLKFQRPNSTDVSHYLSRDAERYVGAQFEYRFGGL
jgi:iron complex outermembrane receptor protein